MTTHHAAILVAMDEEAAPFLQLADEKSEPERIGFAEHRDIRIGELNIHLVRTGIGTVNAASAATAVLLRTRPAALISAGTAGGVGRDVAVGDVVVGDSYVALDADVRAFDYELGQVPGMPARFSANAILLAAAREAEGAGVHVGLMASGDSFTTPARAERILADFPGALSVDMETAAIAQVAHTHGAEFISVRGISDLCDPVAAESFTSNAPKAARGSAAVIIAATRRILALRPLLDPEMNRQR